MPSNRQVGVLWQRESQGGTKYLSGVISMGVFGECGVVVFRVSDKRSEQSPDFIVYASTPQAQRQNGVAEADQPVAKGDDDLPF